MGTSKWTEELQAMVKPIAIKQGLMSPTGQRGTVVEINEDQTVTVKNYYAPGKGSLAAISLQGMDKIINSMDYSDIVLLIVAIKARPFALGTEKEVLQKINRELLQPVIDNYKKQFVDVSNYTLHQLATFLGY